MALIGKGRLEITSIYPDPIIINENNSSQQAIRISYTYSAGLGDGKSYCYITADGVRYDGTINISYTDEMTVLFHLMNVPSGTYVLTCKYETASDTENVTIENQTLSTKTNNISLNSSSITNISLNSTNVEEITLNNEKVYKS